MAVVIQFINFDRINWSFHWFGHLSQFGNLGWFENLGWFGHFDWCGRFGHLGRSVALDIKAGLEF